MPVEKESKENSKNTVNYYRILSLVIQMVAIIALSFWGGNKLDTYVGNSTPVYSIIIGITGMLVSIFYTAYQVNKIFDNK